MKINLIQLSFLILILYCCKNKENELFGIIDGEKIYLSYIDSLSCYKMNAIKTETFDLLTKNIILKKEAEINKITIDSLIIKNIDRKIKITKQDIEQYIVNSKKNSFYTDFKIDTNKLMNYLFFSKKDKLLNQYTDSLKIVYNVNQIITQQINNIQLLNRLYTHDRGNLKSKDVVYVIFNYNCSVCIEIQKELIQICNNFKNKYKFSFVYYSDYIEKSALACEAASNQGKFHEMHNHIIDNINQLNDSVYYTFALKLNLNMNQFNKDFENTDILKLLLKNRDLIKNIGINNVPAYIVNGNVINSFSKFKEYIYQN